METRASILTSEGAARSNDDIVNLQRAVTGITSRVDAIAQSISSTTRLAMSLSAALTDTNASIESKTKRRLLLFMRRNAVQILRAGHAVLARKLMGSQLCASNAVVQVQLKSKQSDCTLADFLLLATAFMRSSLFQCKLFPSDFYAFHRDTGKCTRLDLLFPSYFDICEAIEVNVDQREDGVYKEKHNSLKQLRAVQIMGVASPDRGTDLECARRILLGKSEPNSSSIGYAHVLYQSRMSWSDNSCDAGFEYRKEELSQIEQATKASQPSSRSREVFRFSDINMPPFERNLYRITWVRSADSASFDRVPADMVTGSIRSFFPAVVIRPRLLTESAQTIFGTRVNGRLLKELLVSPDNTH